MADETTNQDELETTAEEPVSAPEGPVAPVTEETTAGEDEPGEQPPGSEPGDLPAGEPAEEPGAEQVPTGQPVAESTAAEAAAADEVVEKPRAKPAKQPKQPKERKPRPKAKRERPAERKPIVRLPKPERERGRTQERRGVVVSDKGDKTIVVRVDTLKAHPMYKKIVRRSKKLHAHDEANRAKVGDVVRIVETRPLSKTKRWRLAEVLEEAK